MLSSAATPAVELTAQMLAQAQAQQQAAQMAQQVAVPLGVKPSLPTSLLTAPAVPLTPESSAQLVQAQQYAMSQLSKYTTDGKSYNLAQAIQDGVSQDTLKNAGFSANQIQAAVAWANLNQIQTQAMAIMTKYTADGKSYDITKALKDGVSEQTLKAAGFTAEQIYQSQQQVQVFQIQQQALSALSKYTSDGKSYNLAQALKDGVSRDILINAGFTTQQIAQVTQSTTATPAQSQISTQQPIITSGTVIGTSPTTNEVLVRDANGDLKWLPADPLQLKEASDILNSGEEYNQPYRPPTPTVSPVDVTVPPSLSGQVIVGTSPTTNEVLVKDVSGNLTWVKSTPAIVAAQTALISLADYAPSKALATYTSQDVIGLINLGAKPQDIVNAGATVSTVKTAIAKINQNFEKNELPKLPDDLQKLYKSGDVIAFNEGLRSYNDQVIKEISDHAKLDSTMADYRLEPLPDVQTQNSHWVTEDGKTIQYVRDAVGNWNKVTNPTPLPSIGYTYNTDAIAQDIVAGKLSKDDATKYFGPTYVASLLAISQLKQEKYLSSDGKINAAQAVVDGKYQLLKDAGLKESDLNQALADAQNIYAYKQKIEAHQDALDRTIAEIDTDIKDPARALSVSNAISTLGLSVPIQGAHMPQLGMLGGVWIDDQTGRALANQEIVERRWNSLTKDQKQQVAGLYAQDLYKTNFFAELTKTLQDASGDAPKQYALSIVRSAPNVYNPKTGLYDLSVAKSADKSYGIDEALLTRAGFDEKDIEAGTKVEQSGQLFDAIASVVYAPVLLPATPIAKYVTHQPVSKTELALGAAAAAGDILTLGGAGALVGLGTAGTKVAMGTGVAVGGTFLGTGVAEQIPNWNDMTPTEQRISLGMDALLLAGIGVGVKGMVTPASQVNKTASVAGGSVGDALKDSQVKVSVPVRIGEKISDIKATISNVGDIVMTSPEAIEYYTKGLGLKLEQVSDLAQRGLLEVTPDLARKVAYNLKTAGANIGNVVMTTPEAIKYYTTDLGIKADRLTELAKRDLLQVTKSIADKVSKSADAGVGIVGKTVMTAPEAIRYYTEGLGLKAEQVMRLTQKQLEVVPDVARQIADNIKKAGASLENRIMTAPEAIDYYTTTLGLKADQLSDLAKKGLLEVAPKRAEQIAKQITSKISDADNFIDTIPNAIDYYAKELNLKTDQIIQLAKKGMPDVSKDQAQTIVGKIKNEIQKGVTNVGSIPDRIAYYTEGLGIKAESVPDKVSGVLSDIYNAMAAKDRARVISKAQELERISAQIDDAGISNIIKSKAQDIQKNADKYITLSDKVDAKNGAKIEDAIKRSEKQVQDYNDLMKKTREFKLTDIGEITPDKTGKPIDVQTVVPEVKEGYTRLYRGEFGGGETWGTQGMNVEGWKGVGFEAGKGRWFTDDINKARAYKQGIAGEIKYVDVLTSEIEKYRVSNLGEDIKTFVPEDRIRDYFFVTKELADSSKIYSISKASELGIGEKYKAGDLPKIEGDVLGETLRDIEKDIKAQSVEPSEGFPIELKPVNVEEQALVDSISKDSIRLNQIQNTVGYENEISELTTRIKDNLKKLDDLRANQVGSVDIKAAIDNRLKDLGYSPDDIATLTDSEKIKIVATNKKPTSIPDVFTGTEKPTPKPESEKGGGVATKEAVKTEEKTKTKVMTSEELEQLMKEKEKVKTEEKTEAKTETKPEEKTERKADTAKPLPEVGEFIISDTSATPYWALVWEDGRIVTKLITPEVLTRGYVELQTKTGNALISQHDLATMTPEQARKLAQDTDLEYYRGASPNIITFPYSKGAQTVAPAPIAPPVPAKQPEPFILPQPVPPFKPASEPQPLPISLQQPQPMPPPLQQPQPQPFPKSEPQPDLYRPQPQPVKEKPKPKMPFAIPLPNEAQMDAAKKAGIPVGSYEWRQGRKWVFLPPPYEDIDKQFLDNPLPGTYRFATGKGSAKATIQVLGGIPAKDATIDMGWATVNVKIENGIPMVEFTGGEEAANTRWDEERAKEAEIAQARYSEFQGLRPMRSMAESEFTPLETPSSEPEPVTDFIPVKTSGRRISNLPELEKRELPQYRMGTMRVFEVNDAYIRSHPDIFKGGMDFTMGGHHYVFDYIPKNETWIGQINDYLDRKATVLHELYEVNLMAGGMEYDKAHNLANIIEETARRNPRIVDDLIQTEITKYTAKYGSRTFVEPLSESYEETIDDSMVATKKPIVKHDIIKDIDKDESEEVKDVPEIKSIKTMKKRKISSEQPVLTSRYYLGHRLPDSELGVSL